MGLVQGRKASISLNQQIKDYEKLRQRLKSRIGSTAADPYSFLAPETMSQCHSAGLVHRATGHAIQNSVAGFFFSLSLSLNQFIYLSLRYCDSFISYKCLTKYNYCRPCTVSEQEDSSSSVPPSSAASSV